MRHVYECPLRWADMDMLGHVNNVTYVDYLQEARIDMFAMHAGFTGAAELAEGVVVVRHEVEFVAPLVFRNEPVLIDVWISRIGAATFTMDYEVYDHASPGREVYLRATSVLAPYVFAGEHPRRLTAEERAALGRFHEPGARRARLDRPGEPRHVYPVHVRFSDVDIYRHVNNVKYFEYIQEARIRYVSQMAERAGEWSDQVVARVDVHYRRPMVLRPSVYEVRSWISRLGGRSFTICADIVDPREGGEDLVLASSETVMVSFDRHTQRAADMPSGQRAALDAQLSAPAPRGC